eukprot:TRINITY_DN1621_c0_g1_i1.p1 TRINITY_DN1621_c0_g1~~TRINITY_DN1621_c0_g1_i1.p1  ORF type:complete len:981 (+),score=166.13 TRINITY_DN1621_c0_g1_i1:122-3064(+)
MPQWLTSLALLSLLFDSVGALITRLHDLEQPQFPSDKKAAAAAACGSQKYIYKYLTNTVGTYIFDNEFCTNVKTVDEMQESQCRTALKSMPMLNGGKSAWFLMKASCRGPTNVMTCQDFVDIDTCPDKDMIAAHDSLTRGCGEDCNIATCCRYKVDECVKKTHRCAVNATCKDTDASYTCTCNTGWAGNGQTCGDRDECKTGEHDCDYYGQCSNTYGSFTCACLKGFTGDGRKCTDINECGTSDNCAKDTSKCNNTDGSFTCQCVAGYVGNGVECTPKSCSLPPAPRNGDLGTCAEHAGLVQGSLPHGGSCMPECNDGWQVEGATTCSFGELKLATCKERDCGFLSPANGNQGDCPTSLVHNSTCTPGCNPGFELEMPPRCHMGQLSPGVCRPADCAKPAAPENGAEGDCTKGLEHGGSCKPGCGSGFSLVGETSCAYGKLTEAYCTPVPCDASRVPAHGTAGDCLPKLGHGATCTPKCEEGFTVSGKTSCESGTLIAATCNPAGCDLTMDKAPLNGKLGENCKKPHLAHGQTCRPTCNPGYTLTADISCSKGKLEIPKCIPDPCDASSAPWNGQVGDCTSKLESGAKCQPVCRQGYTVTGPARCDLGVLTSPTCEPSACNLTQLPPVKNGDFGTCLGGKLSHGSTCQPVCLSGYKANGATSCSLGSLTPASCEPLGCDGSEQVPNGGIGNCKEKMAHGDTCTPSCEQGFELSQATTCTLGVLKKGLCEMAGCNGITPPENGKLGSCICTQDNCHLPSGGSCKPECNEGYEALNFTTCTMGQLKIATCAPVGCGTPKVPDNGKAGTCFGKLAHGATCEPECRTGYESSGPTSCNRGTLVESICKPRSCDASEDLENGHPGTCGKVLNHGATCQPTCDAGYEVSGQRTCNFGVVGDVTCERKSTTAGSASTTTTGKGILITSPKPTTTAKGILITSSTTTAPPATTTQPAATTAAATTTQPAATTAAATTAAPVATTAAQR